MRHIIDDFVWSARYQNLSLRNLTYRLVMTRKLVKVSSQLASSLSVLKFTHQPVDVENLRVQSVEFGRGGKEFCHNEQFGIA